MTQTKFLSALWNVTVSHPARHRSERECALHMWCCVSRQETGASSSTLAPSKLLFRARNPDSQIPAVSPIHPRGFFQTHPFIAVAAEEW